MCPINKENYDTSERVVFFGITLVAGVYYFFGMGGQLREDPLHVYETILQLTAKDFQAFEPGGCIFHRHIN